MEASKVLKTSANHDDEMHECHQKDRIDRIEVAVNSMAVDMAKVVTNTSWIRVLSLFMAGTWTTTIVGIIVYLIVK